MISTPIKLLTCSLFLWSQAISVQAEESVSLVSSKTPFTFTKRITENSNEWQGINAIGSVNQSGVYGTQGVPSATTTPGGRDSATSWIDNKGNLWLFGGEYQSPNNFGVLNDLWKFDPTAAQWTWVSGANTFNSMGSANVPSARFGAVSWADASDNLWLFGGLNAEFGYANDMWLFNPNTSQWTQARHGGTISYGTQGVSSSTNLPGGKEFAAASIDANGCLWLFAGFGSVTSNQPGGYLNDLWKFDPGSSQWVWISGSNQLNPHGSYGTQGVANSTNAPSGRFAAVSWMDSRGNLWFFGGEGYDAHGSFGYLNDLWKFDPKTNQWTWVSGSNTVEQKSSYGTQGVASSSNVPGARAFTGSWIDTSDNLWLTDGNEVWRFDTKTGQWTWISGTAASDQQNDNNTPSSPGSRSRLNVWFDQYSRVWLFGGEGSGEMGDLWMHENF